MLEIKDLSVFVEGKEILKGVNLKIKKGTIHALMGPNGSGKTTLAKVIAGVQEGCEIKGKINFLGKDLLKMEPEERAKAGIFLAFQNPIEIPGLSFLSFLTASLKEIRVSNKKQPPDPINISSEIQKRAKVLGLKKEFLLRGVNEGFSGGEKKRSEVFQMTVLEPKLAILDEIDSGLDVDALKRIVRVINSFRKKDNAFLLITHYQRILNYIKPDFVHIMSGGKIIRSGPAKLALEVEKRGYGYFC